MVAPLLLGLLGGMASAATAKSKEERAMAAKMAMLEAQQESDLKKALIGEEGGIKALAAIGKPIGDVSSAEMISAMSQFNQVEQDLDEITFGNIKLPTINAIDGSGFDQAQSHLSHINTYFARPENMQKYNALSQEEKQQFSMFLGSAVSMYDQRATKMEGGSPVYGAMQTAEVFAPVAYGMLVANPYNARNYSSTGQSTSFMGQGTSSMGQGTSYPGQQAGGNVNLEEGKTSPEPVEPFEPVIQSKFGEVIKETVLATDGQSVIDDTALQMTEIYQAYFPDASNISGLAIDPNTAFFNVQKLFSDRSKNFSKEAAGLATEILRTKTGRNILFGRYAGRESDLQTLFRDFIDPRDESQVGTFIDAMNIIMPSVGLSGVIQISDTKKVNTTTTGGKIDTMERPGNIPEDKEKFDEFVMKRLNQSLPFKDVKAIPKNYAEFDVRKKNMQDSVNTYRDMLGIVSTVGLNNIEMQISMVSDSVKNTISAVASSVSSLANQKRTVVRADGTTGEEYIFDAVARKNIGNIMKDYESGEATLSRVLQFYAYQAAYQRAKALEGAGARLSQQDFDRAYANVRGALAETNEMTKIRFQLLAGDSFIENLIFRKADEALQLVKDRTNVKEHIPFIKKFVRSTNAIGAFRAAVPEPISVARELFRVNSDGTNIGIVEGYRPSTEVLRNAVAKAKEKYGENTSVDASVYIPAENIGGERRAIAGFDVYFLAINTPDGRIYQRIPLSSLVRVQDTPESSDEKDKDKSTGGGFDTHPETDAKAGDGFQWRQKSDGTYIKMPKF